MQTLLETLPSQRQRLHMPRRDLYIAGVTGWPRVHVPDAPRCLNPDRRRASKKLRAFKELYFPKSLYPQFIADSSINLICSSQKQSVLFTKGWLHGSVKPT